MKGLSGDAIDALVELARATPTAQFKVVQGGVTLVDEVMDPDPVDVEAVQHGILSLMIGIAEEKYLLEVIDNANHHLDPEWTQLSPWDEASLTIECLLTMTTGMDDELGPLGKIGETWRYNPTACSYLKKILCSHTGQTLNAVTREWLLDPLAMSDTGWNDREIRLPDGRPFTGLKSTASDLVKVGCMVLGDSEVNLVPKHYLARMTEPGSAENPAWGLCWWNNNQSRFKLPLQEDQTREGPAMAGGPPDMIATRGAFDNGLYLVPSARLVVARTARPGEPGGFEGQLFDLLGCA